MHFLDYYAENSSRSYLFDTLSVLYDQTSVLYCVTLVWGLGWELILLGTPKIPGLALFLRLPIEGAWSVSHTHWTFSNRSSVCTIGNSTHPSVRKLWLADRQTYWAPLRLTALHIFGLRTVSINTHTHAHTNMVQLLQWQRIVAHNTSNYATKSSNASKLGKLSFVAFVFSCSSVPSKQTHFQTFCTLHKKHSLLFPSSL